MKVPAIIASSLICLLLGLGIGVLGMTYFGPIELPEWLGGRPTPTAAADDGPAPGPPMMPKGMGGKGGKGGGQKGPSPKTQLGTLVARLDALTQKPLTISLDADQKKQVATNLKGLDQMDSLSDEDAKKRLDGLLAAVKDHKDTLEKTGFRWPGEPAMGPPPGIVPNPFKFEPNSKHLQALEERLGTPAPKSDR